MPYWQIKLEKIWENLPFKTKADFLRVQPFVGLTFLMGFYMHSVFVFMDTRRGWIIHRGKNIYNMHFHSLFGPFCPIHKSILITTNERVSTNGSLMTHLDH